MGKASSIVDRFTETFVRSADAGEFPQRIFWERHLRGFGLRVGAGGAKSFIVQREVAGKTRRVTIGRYGVKTLDEARRKARAELGRMEDGVDPKTERAKAKVLGLTLAQALKLYYEEEGKRKPRTREGAKKAIETWLKDWLQEPLVNLGTDAGREVVRKRHRAIAAEVAKRHAKAQKKGKYTERNGHTTANNVMVAFSAVWHRAMKASAALPVCPTINVNWFPKSPKMDPIPEADLPQWHAAVRAYPNAEKSALLHFALYTGLRSSDARSVRWEDVDLTHAVLRIPDPSKRRAKDGDQPRDLPLSRQLVALLTERQREHEAALKKKKLPEQAAPWVFGAWSEKGHVVDARVEVPGVPFRTHSLRHTFAQAGREHAKVDEATLAALMDHKHGRDTITHLYGRKTVDHLREPMQRISDALDALTKQKRSAR